MSLPGIVWLEHTTENAAASAATAAVGVLASVASKTLADVSWGSVLSSAGYAALSSVLLAVIALRQNNGTASFNPHVTTDGRT